MSGTNWGFGHNVHGMDYVEREKQPFTPTPALKDGLQSNICFSARDFQQTFVTSNQEVARHRTMTVNSSAKSFENLGLQLKTKMRASNVHLGKESRTSSAAYLETLKRGKSAIMSQRKQLEPAGQEKDKFAVVQNSESGRNLGQKRNTIQLGIGGFGSSLDVRRF